MAIRVRFTNMILRCERWREVDARDPGISLGDVLKKNASLPGRIAIVVREGTMHCHREGHVASRPGFSALASC